MNVVGESKPGLGVSLDSERWRGLWNGNWKIPKGTEQIGMYNVVARTIATRSSEHISKKSENKMTSGVAFNLYE